MPETEEEMLALLHEFDDRVKFMTDVLYAFNQKNVISDRVTGALLNDYWIKLMQLNAKYDLIDLHMTRVAKRKEA